MTTNVPPATTPADGFAWRRVHPVTPLVRGWLVLVVLVVGFGRQVLQQGGQEEAFALRHLGWFALGVLVIVALTLLASWLSWRFTSFAVDDDAVHVRRGVVFKQHRKARLDRIQAIDVRQPLAARLFGLAELKVEVAGGGDSGATIGFLREAEARALRADLLARAAGVAPAPGPPAPAGATGPRAATAGPATPSADAPVAPRGRVGSIDLPPALEAPEREVYEVPGNRLLLSTLLTGEAVALAVFVLAAVVTGVATRSVASLFAFVWPALGLGSAVLGRFNRGFAFRAATSPDGIRLRHGLTETRSQTIPPGRVQAVELSQPLLWRRFGWWRVRVNVAGFSVRGDRKELSTVLHPVGTFEEALTAVWLVLPDLGTVDPVALLREGMTGSGPSAAFVAAPRRARWLDPVAWRRTAFAVTARAVLARTGRVRRHLVVVPHERTQSLGLRQGPLQRRLGVATFSLHSTPGAVTPQVPHLDAATARRLLDEQAGRAREARAHDRPEQWMRREPAS